MKRFISTLIIVASFALAAGGAKAYAQYYDDIYTSPTEARKQREESNKKAEERRKAEAKEREIRLKAQQQAEEEEAYYYDPVDTNGFTEYEIDAYNRRNGTDTVALRTKAKNQTSKAKASSKKKPTYQSKYAKRISRFHSDDAIVAQRGERVYIITDDGYDGYDEYGYDYGYGYDGEVNIYITAASLPWYYNSYYPWSDPWFYDPFYYQGYWGSRYYSHYGWGGWSHCGWGYPGCGPSWGNGYYHGYHDGYYDGYYNGYYAGGGYDPYSGRAYQNNYQHGRRSSENFGGRYNDARQAGRISSSSQNYNNGRSNNASGGRKEYDRGTFWTSSANREAYNTNNNAGGRAGVGVNRERGVFQTDGNNAGRIFSSQSGEDRRVYRAPQRARTNMNGNGRSTGNFNRERGIFGQERSRNNGQSVDNSRSRIESQQRQTAEPVRRDTWQQQRSSNSTERQSSSSSSGNSGGGGGNHNTGGRR